MPIVKIDLKKGKPENFKQIFMESIRASMIETLMIPAEDNNQRLSEYDAAHFYAKPPYEYFIEIIMFSGRTKETKSRLFKSIVEKLHDNLDIDPLSVFIVINEQSMDNWGIQGGIQASELQLNFKIKI